ncbi:hypothetical protein F8M41_014414 [Gigaspora margarita]|uniref:Uncharacterized protein n=1 Tax=Gigaspora margarita TaxID=4874 RepID=A0A8H4ENT3_GIGMA|nr:hypothetical protein F8M41_014414 [Gigaspora margarita]
MMTPASVTLKNKTVIKDKTKLTNYSKSAKTLMNSDTIKAMTPQAIAPTNDSSNIRWIQQLVLQMMPNSSNKTKLQQNINDSSSKRWFSKCVSIEDNATKRG